VSFSRQFGEVTLREAGRARTTLAFKIHRACPITGATGTGPAGAKIVVGRRRIATAETRLVDGEGSPRSRGAAPFMLFDLQP
jgi:hypothetical protein